MLLLRQFLRWCSISKMQQKCSAAILTCVLLCTLYIQRGHDSKSSHAATCSMSDSAISAGQYVSAATCVSTDVWQPGLHCNEQQSVLFSSFHECTGGDRPSPMHLKNSLLNPVALKRGHTVHSTGSAVSAGVAACRSSIQPACYVTTESGVLCCLCVVCCFSQAQVLELSRRVQGTPYQQQLQIIHGDFMKVRDS